jgi:protein arginine N-methyltransferase 1
MLADPIRNLAFRRALERVIVPGRTTVSDIGAGTGALGFLARRLGAREVWLYEAGPALDIADRIAERNGLDGIRLVAAYSLDVDEPERTDVVVAEVLGNFAYEENVLETLADAYRFLTPGGTLIPRAMTQHVAPVVSGRFHRDLTTWDRVEGLDLDLADARIATMNNMYVFAIEPEDLLAEPSAAQQWDAVEFSSEIESVRRGEVAWILGAPAEIYGFALWWECELVPGVTLTTSPYAPRTHWDQIYLPLDAPLAGERGDEISLVIESETGGGEAGIDVRWQVEQRRGNARIARQAHDLGSGYIG